jgi:2-hydroxycyclohexanecarboxyl-CoA dehydrogenase
VNVLGTAFCCKAAVPALRAAGGGTIAPYHIRRAAGQGQSEAELRRRTANENLLGRWAEPREIAQPILFLSCEASSHIIGATLMVDAGKSIG